MSKLLADLQTRLAHRFERGALLEQALTHRSHSARNNERLEFLGDGVLNFVVAALLFERYPSLPEGDLSRLRANLVKQATLADIAQTLQLSGVLRLGEGELKSGGFRRPSILADTVEALLGAVFLDAGFTAARTVIEQLYAPRLAQLDPKAQGKDAKTVLQEFLQGHQLALPVYRVLATHGAAHDQQFEVQCHVTLAEGTDVQGTDTEGTDGLRFTASGSSRRAAEQVAAQLALEALLKLPEVALKAALKAGRHATKATKSAKAAKVSRAAAQQFSAPVTQEVR